MLGRVEMLLLNLQQLILDIQLRVITTLKLRVARVTGAYFLLDQLVYKLFFLLFGLKFRQIQIQGSVLDFSGVFLKLETLIFLERFELIGVAIELGS